MDYVDGEPLFNISLSTEKWQQVIEQVKKYFQYFIVPIYSLVISVAVRLCLNEIHNGELKVELVGFNRGEEDEFTYPYFMNHNIQRPEGDKQQVASRKRVINGNSPKTLEKGLVEKEHNKCKNIGEHIFLFVTDSKKRSDETYKENEILIAEEEKNYLLGDLLTNYSPTPK
nr:15013_t:CDS:2 [Entrophospora candida]